MKELISGVYFGFFELRIMPLVDSERISDRAGFFDVKREVGSVSHIYTIFESDKIFLG